MANLSSDDISVLFNDGDGIFADAIEYGAGDEPGSVSSADLDNDNDNDLAVANASSDNVSILLNNGDGTFAAAIDYGAGNAPRAIFSADFDGDNDGDLAVANSISNNVSILSNQTRWGTTPATVPASDTMSYIFAYTVAPLELTLYMGNFDSGYTASDVNTETISINSAIDPASAAVITSHPAFDGEVLEVVFLAREFILGYGILWDASVQPYTVTGEYSDNSPFTAVGRFIFVGHRSGDVNTDGEINIYDVSYLLTYLYLTGPTPRFPETADVNNDGSLNIFDITYLIDFLYMGGPEPISP